MNLGQVIAKDDDDAPRRARRATLLGRDLLGSRGAETGGSWSVVQTCRHVEQTQYHPSRNDLASLSASGWGL